ncbi:MAG: hypothetical protein GF411_06660 [Candidatus Lokiarchaeota archaeon]|nr:hypothetical protein [Candidatus Lokiarchaeota archaeon]
MDCPVCGRPIIENGEYCKYHDEANSNLYSSYEEWKKALPISWIEYLIEVEERKETGKWVKELIEYFRTIKSL